MRGLRYGLTARGAAFVAAGAVLVLMGIGLGQQDLTRVGVLLLALTAGAALLGRRHSLQLGVQRLVRPARVSVDEAAVVTVTLTNAEGIRSPVLMAEEQLDAALGDRPRFVVPPTGPRQERAVQYAVRSPTRGVHRLGPLAVRVTDPFGLTSRAASVGGAGSLVVIPRVHALTAARQLGRGVGAEGSVPHRVALHGEDDQAIREYRDGDDLRRIHWPATARTGELMVRQEDRPAKRRAVLLLDSRAQVHAGIGRDSSLEWCVTAAASVTAHLIGLGYTVHLVTADPAADSGSREDTELTPALDTLARLQPGPEDGYRAVLHRATSVTAGGGVVVALTAGLDDDEAHATSSLRQSGSTGIALITDPQAFGRRGGRLPPQRGADSGAGTASAALTATGWAVALVGPDTTVVQAWAGVSSSDRVGAA